MDNSSIYADIAARTGGNIYIGVVGPVRTGKSTFIKRFMETLVLPNISDDYVRERARDDVGFFLCLSCLNSFCGCSKTH